MLRNRNPRDDVGRLGRSPEVSPPHPRWSAYETPVSPTGVSSCQRRSPITTRSVWQLPLGNRRAVPPLRNVSAGAVSSRHFGWRSHLRWLRQERCGCRVRLIVWCLPFGAPRLRRDRADALLWASLRQPATSTGLAPRPPSEP